MKQISTELWVRLVQHIENQYCFGQVFVINIGVTIVSVKNVVRTKLD
jgi:hypothetical protein